MNKYYFRGYSWSNVGKKIKGSYQFFDGTKIKVINAKEGKTILDSSNDLVAELQTNTTGIKEINSDKNQKYRLVIRGTQTKGSFNVNWEIS